MQSRPMPNWLMAILILGLTAAFIFLFALLDYLGIMGQTGRIKAILLMSSIGLLSSIKELTGLKKMKPAQRGF